ncbi:DUF3800 domain-containing protein [Candidatus Poribacteria bacterium]|nr:DUF3800 domain-containing protein [Candidatus Poribacteria bacterium]
MEKLFCYIDESGQDTERVYFIVAVVISDQQAIQGLGRTLEQIEQQTTKGRRKWRPTRPNVKVAYLERILQLPQFRHSIFYQSFHHHTGDYTGLTTETIAQAISSRARGDYQAYITIDGLNEKERNRIARGLRQRGIRRQKLRGGREESSALLRLADAMAGFIGDYEEGESYAQDLYRRFTSQHIITKL